LSGDEVQIAIARLDERVKDLEEFKSEVSQDLKGIRNTQSGILGGIIIACILLIINMAIGR
jgi:tetrahydromethanopterin S-methyltransferase subunit G